MANDSGRFNLLDHGIKELMMEIEHQMRISQKKFFGCVKLELTYRDGSLFLVKVQADRTLTASSMNMLSGQG